MQLHAAVPFSSSAQVLNPPGMTPLTARLPGAPATGALRADTFDRHAPAEAVRRTPPARHKVLELMEDALLLLLAVFMFPAVIMLLALPMALMLQVAAEIGRRW